MDARRALVPLAALVTLALTPIPGSAGTIAVPNVFPVDSAGDGGDANTADDVCDDGAGACTLRAAIEQANATANAVAGPDEIHFDITPNEIAPVDVLPAITDPVLIDGTTDPDSTHVELDGANAGILRDGLNLSTGSDGSVVRGLSIHGWTRAGISIGLPGDITIQGNIIGLEADGTTADPNTREGITLTSDGNTIGGSGAGEGNVISSSVERTGLNVGGDDNIVQGNMIGTDASGALDRGNAGRGIAIINGSGNLVGGTAPGAGNVIRHNAADGIAVLESTGTSVGNAILGNAIADHEAILALGIDLGSDNPETNDDDDLDTGPNNLQNFPVIDTAVAGSLDVTGTFEGEPDTDFRLEFFTAPTGHPSGHGEGLTFAGAATVTTDANGEATFDESFPFAATAGEVATATATKLDGTGAPVETSEFSEHQVILEPGTHVFTVNDTGDVADDDAGDGACDTGTGVCTLRAAIEEANALANAIEGPDEIRFDVPGTGPHVITPGVSLPAITQSIVIDGTTEPDFAGTPVVALDGSTAGGVGIDVETGSASIRGLAVHGFGTGIFTKPGSSGNEIVGSYLGLETDGTTAEGNSFGLRVGGGPGTTVGGTGAGEGNVFGSNVRHLDVLAPGTLVHGNLFGTDAGGTLDRGSGLYGVGVSSAGSGSTIGGTGPGEGNTILHSGQDAIRSVSDIGGDASFAILGNDIGDSGSLAVDDGALAIDLENDGVTPNDAGDADTGPNGLQNFPEIAFAVAGSLVTSGTLSSVPDTDFRVEVFRNTAVDPSGFGESDEYLTSLEVTTDAEGRAVFSLDDPGSTVAAGEHLTATATRLDAVGDPVETSEVSAAVEILACDLTGDAGDNLLVGTPADEVLCGLGGADTLDGGGGDDVLLGGPGDDTLAGGPGADVLDGGDGADEATYAAAAAGIVADLATGASADGDGSTDTFFGLEELTGSASDDTLAGAPGQDDTIVGGAGTDTLDLSSEPSAVAADLAAGSAAGASTDAISGIENVTGTAFADTIVGDGAPNVLDGGGGGDTLSGGGGADAISGGAGTDTASYVTESADLSLSLDGVANDGAEGEGDNLDVEVLLAGAGDDTLSGSPGVGNTLDGGAGSDTVSYAAAPAGVTADLGAGSATDDGAGGVDALVGIEHLIGSAFADDLTGDAGSNAIAGEDGADTLSGGDGDDTLEGGAGGDTLAGDGGDDHLDTGGGADIATGGAGKDTLLGKAGKDTLKGGGGKDTAKGGGGNDKLRGQGGPDILRGQGGNDDLKGNAGNDKLFGNAGNDDLNGGGGKDTCKPGGGKKDTVKKCEKP